MRKFLLYLLLAAMFASCGETPNNTGSNVVTGKEESGKEENSKEGNNEEEKGEEGNGETSNLDKLPDATLSESICTNGYSYITGAHGEYNGVALPEIRKNANLFHTLINSDTEVEMHCRFSFGDERFVIVIPNIPILGKPYDVSFDHEAIDAYIQRDTNEHPAVVTVTGWMKAVGAIEAGNDYYRPDYECELHLACQFEDGQTLNVTITAVDFSSMLIID